MRKVPFVCFVFSPIVFEVPHFAALRGDEREIAILRSDNGQTWREHSSTITDESVQELVESCFEGNFLIQCSIYRPFSSNFAKSTTYQ